MQALHGGSLNAGTAWWLFVSSGPRLLSLVPHWWNMLVRLWTLIIILFFDQITLNLPTWRAHFQVFPAGCT